MEFFLKFLFPPFLLEVQCVNLKFVLDSNWNALNGVFVKVRTSQLCKKKNLNCKIFYFVRTKVSDCRQTKA